MRARYSSLDGTEARMKLMVALFALLAVVRGAAIGEDLVLQAAFPNPGFAPADAPVSHRIVLAPARMAVEQADHLRPVMRLGPLARISSARYRAQVISAPKQTRRLKQTADEKRLRLSAQLVASASISLAAAAVAHISTQRADDAYDRYLKSASLRRQKAQFDRAERYDRLSGAAFALMEAGIVWSAYQLFF